MRAAVYVRVSTQEQAREGYSVEAQRRVCLEFCERRRWTVADTYADDGFSAKDTKRPALQRLLADARQRRFAAVVVWKLDRFTRRQRDCLNLIQGELEPYGVGFISATQDFDTTTSAGRAMLGMLAVFAELERDQLIERVRFAIAEQVRQGKWAGGQPPLGYRVGAEGFLEVDPDRAPIAKLIFSLAAQGWPKRRLCSELERRGVPRPRYAPEWGPRTISKLLENRTYLGELWRRDGGWRAGGHPALIDLDTWHAAQVHVQMRRDGYRPRPDTLSLLSGLARCAVCGSVYRYKSSVPGKAAGNRTVYAYYVCANQERGHGCSVRPVRAEVLDRQVTEAVVGLALDEEAARRAIAGDGRDAEELEAELRTQERIEADAARRVAFWYKAAEDGRITIAQMQGHLERLETERAAAAERRQQAAAELQAAQARSRGTQDLLRLLRQVSGDLPKMNRMKQKQVLRQVVEEVRFAPEHGLHLRLRVFDAMGT